MVELKMNQLAGWCLVASFRIWVQNGVKEDRSIGSSG